MQLITKWCTASILTVCALSTYPNAAYAQDIIPQTLPEIRQRMVSLEKRINLLEQERVEYGPIVVSHVRFNNRKHFSTVAPGQTIQCSFHYKLDSSQQDFLTKNHLIVGLKGVAAENCATHLYGVWDSSGTANFKLMAPLQPGEYEVRIAYRPGDKCEDALNSWNVLKDEPGSFATVGFLRVVNKPVSK